MININLDNNLNFIFNFIFKFQFFTQKNISCIDGIESPLKYLKQLNWFMGDELKAGALILVYTLVLSSQLFLNKLPL